MGDWDIRGPDYDTDLIGAISATHIDADRLARLEHRTGFPSWGMYRAAMCGDALYLRRLKDWCIAFAVAYGTTGGVRRSAYSDDLACVAGLDALHIVIHSREMQPPSVSAADVGVDLKTYTRFRDALVRRLTRDLIDYWAQLGCAFRQVKIYERKSETRETHAILELKGTRFGPAWASEYYTAPATESDFL